MNDILIGMDAKIKARRDKHPFASKLNSLITRARNSAKLRGHDLKRFSHSEDGLTAISHCRDCNEWVQVDVKPAPNGIDVGGPAVGLNCRD